MPITFDSITEKTALRVCNFSIQETVNRLLLQDRKTLKEIKTLELEALLRNPDWDRKENKKEIRLRGDIHKLSDEIECYENTSHVLRKQTHDEWHKIKFLVKENLRDAIEKNPDEPIVLSNQLHVHTAYIVQKILEVDGFDGFFEATGQQEAKLQELMDELNLDQDEEEEDDGGYEEVEKPSKIKSAGGWGYDDKF